MKNFVTSTKRVTWHFWMLLLSFVSAILTTPANNGPEMFLGPTRPRLILYQSSTKVSITVYHCLYQEQDVCDGDICSNCGIDIDTVVGQRTRRRSLISKDCLDRFKAADIYGSEREGYFPARLVNSSYICNDAELKRTTSTTLRKYSAEANFAHDVIVLNSGTVCRFSFGFCHDEKKDIDVFWETTTTGGHINCDQLTEIRVLDTYYFTFNSKIHALIKTQYGYVGLELKNPYEKCGVLRFWDTDQGFMLADGKIRGAVDGPVDAAATTFRSTFRDKQLLYDFLVEKSSAESSKVNYTASRRYDDLLEKFLMRDQNNYLIKQQNFFQWRLEVCFYLSLSAVLCFVSILIYATCCSCAKKACICECKVSKSCRPSSYEDIDSLGYEIFKVKA